MKSSFRTSRPFARSKRHRSGRRRIVGVRIRENTSRLGLVLVAIVLFVLLVLVPWRLIHVSRAQLPASSDHGEATTHTWR